MPQEPFIESYTIEDGEILVIKLHGKLDLASTPEFNEEVHKHFEQGRHKIIIDCAYLGYVSSVGIGALVSLQTKLKREGGEVKLAAIQGPAAEVMKLVRLDKMIGLYGDIEFARESFAN